VLKFRFVPNPLNSPFQKFEVNFGSLSDTIVLGIPCKRATSFKKISTTSAAWWVVFNGVKWAALVSLSTTTMIESCCLLVLGSQVIKSIFTTSHFHSGMGKGCSNPAGCLCSALTFWHSIHMAMYSMIYFFKPHQK
jgi:hypothetical protein